MGWKRSMFHDECSGGAMGYPDYYAWILLLASCLPSWLSKFCQLVACGLIDSFLHSVCLFKMVFFFTFLWRQSTTILKILWMIRIIDEVVQFPDLLFDVTRIASNRDFQKDWRYLLWERRSSKKSARYQYFASFWSFVERSCHLLSFICVLVKIRARNHHCGILLGSRYCSSLQWIHSFIHPRTNSSIIPSVWLIFYNITL